MLPLREAKARVVAQERGSAEGKPTTFRQGEGSSGVSRSSALIHPIAEKSSSRKPAEPKVATYRITSHPGEYRAWFWGRRAGRRGACSGLSTPCMSRQDLAVVVVQGHKESRGC